MSRLDRQAPTATVHPLFYDEPTAAVANVGPSPGQQVKLAPTDPDSIGAYTAGGTVDVVTGPFRPGSVFVADTPCDLPHAGAAMPPVPGLRGSRRTTWAS